MFTFVPKKSFGQLLDISPKNFVFLKFFNLEFSYIEVWFTDQNFKSPSATCAFKTSSKRAIQKAAEATDDLIGNKVANKIT